MKSTWSGLIQTESPKTITFAESSSIFAILAPWSRSEDASPQTLTNSSYAIQLFPVSLSFVFTISICAALRSFFVSSTVKLGVSVSVGGAMPSNRILPLLPSISRSFSIRLSPTGICMISGRIMAVLCRNRREIEESPGSGAILASPDSLGTLVRTANEEDEMRQFVRLCEAWFEMLKRRFVKSFLIAIDRWTNKFSFLPEREKKRYKTKININVF